MRCENQPSVGWFFTSSELGSWCFVTNRMTVRLLDVPIPTLERTNSTHAAQRGLCFCSMPQNSHAAMNGWHNSNQSKSCCCREHSSFINPSSQVQLWCLQLPAGKHLLLLQKCWVVASRQEALGITSQLSPLSCSRLSCISSYTTFQHALTLQPS